MIDPVILGFDSQLLRQPLLHRSITLKSLALLQSLGGTPFLPTAELLALQKSDCFTANIAAMPPFRYCINQVCSVLRCLPVAFAIALMLGGFSCLCHDSTCNRSLVFGVFACLIWAAISSKLSLTSTEVMPAIARTCNVTSKLILFATFPVLIGIMLQFVTGLFQIWGEMRSHPSAISQISSTPPHQMNPADPGLGQTLRASENKSVHLQSDSGLLPHP